jgi:hypothetical protein
MRDEHGRAGSAAARRRWERALPACLLLALAVSAAPAGTAAADGPGYSGRADRLSVAWARTTVHALGPDGTGQVAGLLVQGTGFAAGTPVTVRVGAGRDVGATADPVGTLAVTVPSAVAGQVAAPGTSVAARGRSPGGSDLVLVGSVPPRPSGSRLLRTLPWLLGGLLLAAGPGRRIRLARRRRLEPVPDTAHGPDVPLGGG